LWGRCALNASCQPYVGIESRTTVINAANRSVIRAVVLSDSIIVGLLSVLRVLGVLGAANPLPSQIIG
jgi:hypothetical protein